MLLCYSNRPCCPSPDAPAGGVIPRCVHACAVATRPLGVRASIPARTRNGSHTSSTVVALLTDRDREGGNSDRTATETAGERRQHGTVEPVQAELVDVVYRQRVLRDVARDDAVGADLGIVAHPAQ